MNTIRWKPDICFYHFPCDDGFAAAWTVRRRWPDVELLPVNYGLPLPECDVTSRNVLFVDFSLKPGPLRELAEKAGSVVILDHHKTAEADLQGFARVRQHNADTIGIMFLGADRPVPGNVAVLFDMERSGAVLTWRFCFPNEAMPSLIWFVEDRDLWRFRIQDSRALSLYLRSWPYDFERWSEIAARLDDPDRGQRQVLLAEARAIERFYDAKIAEIVPTATLRRIGTFDGVPTAHAPYAFVSDVGHELLKAHPDAPFAAVVVDAHGGRTFSLRSEDRRHDVSAVARLFGGGGHRNAAGFRVATAEASA